MKFTVTAESIAEGAGQGWGGSRGPEEGTLQGRVLVCAPECTLEGCVNVHEPESREGLAHSGDSVDVCGSRISGHQAPTSVCMHLGTRLCESTHDGGVS